MTNPNDPEVIKQMAMNISENNANKSFMEVAIVSGLYLSKTNETFTSADIRDLMEEKFPTLSTHDDRALGAVMRKLSRNGIIHPTGRYVSSKRARNHNRPLREWRGTRRHDAEKESTKE